MENNINNTIQLYNYIVTVTPDPNLYLSGLDCKSSGTSYISDDIIDDDLMERFSDAWKKLADS